MSLLQHSGDTDTPPKLSHVQQDPEHSSYPQGKVLCLLDPCWNVREQGSNSAHLTHRPALASGHSHPVPPGKVGNGLSLLWQMGTKDQVTWLGPAQHRTPTAFGSTGNPSRNPCGLGGLETGCAQSPSPDWMWMFSLKPGLQAVFFCAVFFKGYSGFFTYPW